MRTTAALVAVMLLSACKTTQSGSALRSELVAEEDVVFACRAEAKIAGITSDTKIIKGADGKLKAKEILLITLEEGEAPVPMTVNFQHDGIMLESDEFKPGPQQAIQPELKKIGIDGSKVKTMACYSLKDGKSEETDGVRDGLFGEGYCSFLDSEGKLVGHAAFNPAGVVTNDPDAGGLFLKCEASQQK